MTPTTGGVKGEVIDYGVNCAGVCCMVFFNRKPVSDLLSFVCIWEVISSKRIIEWLG